MEVKNILEVSDEELENRITFINDQLNKLSVDLRKEIPILEDAELIKNEKFKKWIICNTIIKQLDEGDNTYKRVLYYMFVECGNVINLLDQYDLKFNRDENDIVQSVELVVIENE